MSINPVQSTAKIPQEVLKDNKPNKDEINEFASLSGEERQKKIREGNNRYIYEQMMTSLRRHTQEMQKQIEEQRKEDES